eukprot:TRINITY_DN1104_c0_g1_i1.p1 TRINITY_DN1104_c0_g1~~TRINITY_DN1104_c0_g1_i1.p1  ORF type:complete len:187 (+),score=23.08 TRINITY_DN1104_c0_g1_i1:791-1351(+)
MQEAVSGESAIRFHAFWGHSFSLTMLWDVMGIPTYTPIESVDTLLLELRRRPNGEVFIRSEFVQTTDPLGTAFIAEDIPLYCPTATQFNCPLNSYIEFLEEHNENSREGGCCYKGRGFMEQCSDYLNPNVLNNPNCVLFREKCPDSSCDVGQILDAATLLCVPVTESGKDELIYKLQSEIERMKEM